jgi:hypothetical protein
MADNKIRVVFNDGRSERRRPTPTKYDCGACNISYTSMSPGCPLCRATREVKDLRQALVEAQNQLHLVHDQLNKSRMNSDILFNITEAAKMLGDDDRAFYKTVLYQWRDGKRIGALKVMHKAKTTSAVGFIVSPRAGDPYPYTCTSMGGLAIASHYEEAARAAGPAAAMQVLARGLQALVPGGSVAE